MNQTLWWRVRWGVVVLSVLMGVVLLVAVGWSYQSARRISKMVARGEGYALLNEVRRDLQRVKGRIQPKHIEVLLKKKRADGLRYVGLYRLSGRKLAEAGLPLGKTVFPLHRKSLLDNVQFLSDNRLRIHVLGLLRPRRHRRRWFFMRRFGRQEGEPFGMRRRMLRRRRGMPPILIIECRSQAAILVQGEARLMLAVGAGGALVLLVVLLGFGALLRRVTRLEGQRQQQQQLAALGEMSAVLAHEIRNPLTSLKGHAQLLEELLPDEHKLKPKAGRVVQEAVRLEELSHQLLDFVRVGTLSRSEVSPVSLVQDVIDELGTECVSLHAEKAPATWHLDETKMRQVLSNLLDNALQASPEGTTVDVFLSVEGKAFRIVVEDAGEGIPEDVLESIFMPFVTTRLHGTGLGLSVARRLVELHGGTLVASNRREGGARFAMILPNV